MGTKATRKDFYMEIKKSLGRFLSIFFIVALGVAFFSGIRASEPAMRITGDNYYDGSDLMDIKVVSTLGITEGDIGAIGDVKGVAEAEGSYSADFLVHGDDRQIVLHVQSLLASLNKVTVSEGRLPVKTGECLVDDAMDYRIGDTILLESGDDKPVKDTLKTDKLTVVGRGNSPCYISYNRGNTTIGTGSVTGFLYVVPGAFKTDVYTEAYAQVEGAKEETAYTDGYDSKVEDALSAVEDITAERGSIRRQELIDEAQAGLDKAKKELEDGKTRAKEELDAAVQKLSQGESQLNDAKAKIEDGRSQLNAARATLNDKQDELNAAVEQYNSGRQQLIDGWAKYQQGQEEYEQKKAAAESQIQSGRQQLSRTRAQLDAGWTQYQGMLDQMDQLRTLVNPTGEQIQMLAELERQEPSVRAELDEGEQAYAAGAAQLDGYQAQLDAGAAELDNSRAVLEESESQLANALSRIQSGQDQINAGWEEINAQEESLKAAESEVASGEPEIADGRKQYEEEKAKAEAEIADGERKIRSAERNISKINNPKWYIYDRNSLPEYTGFGDNADRMRQIGKVFPVLFFLVAALISLTSMTRMVEEQRTEIGTMKALGYGKFTIASKYLGYALLATMGGSILGVLFGEKVLPYIIIYAYEILYHHLPVILTPYNLAYAAWATTAAVACTMIATLAACYRELSAQPAVLMRPPAPKNGKRVFMERIGFVWRHLSFTWKSTVRNLMRYKKRFFMTIFGIGGCMALMLVGFGLRDSIFDIASIQYQQIQTYEGTAYLEEDIRDEERTELAGYLSGHDGIKAFMDADMRNVTAKNGDEERDVYECVPRDVDGMESFIHLRDRKTKEEYALTDQGIILSEKTAKLLDARVGDTIEIKEGESSYKPVRVDQICENYMGHYLYMTPALYQELYGKEPEYNCIYFKTTDASGGALDETGQDILALDEVMSVTYLKDFMKQLDDMLKSLNLVIVVLIVSAGMLAFVVLYNLNNINITERQRELATIKVLGFYDPEVAAYVYRENILLTVIGACAGMLMGRILHLFIIQTVEVDAAMFGRNINFPSYVYSFLFTIAFSAFVNWVMYFKLKRIDMVESLKSIE